MSVEIIAALIGLGGTLAAALIGLWAVRRDRGAPKPDDISSPPAPIGPAPAPKVPEKRLVGNLVDFFELRKTTQRLSKWS